MKWNKSNDVLAVMVGHGKSLDGTWDCGCSYGQYTEAGLMLPIVQAAVKLLRKSGVKVITDADDANNRNMKSSVAWANNRKAKIYISVHCAWSGSSSGIYPQVKTSADKALGAALGKKVAKLLDMKYKGCATRNDLYELNAPTAQACCVYECGSIKADLKKLKESKKYGRALAKAICAYIGVDVYVSKRTQFLRKDAEILAYMNKHHFKYAKSYKACGTSWAQAKKTKKSNCATKTSWAAQEVGLLQPGQIFWINGTAIKCVGSGTKARIKKTFTIKHPKKSPKTAGLKAGYIVGYKDNPHTQEFVKWNKDKKPLWYSWGPSDVGKKQPRHKKSYDSKKIMTVLIPK